MFNAVEAHRNILDAVDCSSRTAAAVLLVNIIHFITMQKGLSQKLDV